MYNLKTGHIIKRMKKRSSSMPSDKQWKFIKEYPKDLKKGDAAVRAGYKRASGQGLYKKWKHLIDIEIQAGLNEAGVDRDYVLRRLKEIDELDVIDILDEDGDLLPLREWPKEWRTSISGVELSRIAQGSEQAILKKIKWPDKVKNLEMLGKHTEILAWGKNEDDTSAKESNGPNIYIVRLPSNGR